MEDMRTILRDALERIRRETGVAITGLNIDWVGSINGSGHVRGIEIEADIGYSDRG